MEGRFCRCLETGAASGPPLLARATCLHPCPGWAFRFGDLTLAPRSPRLTHAACRTATACQVPLLQARPSSPRVEEHRRPQDDWGQELPLRLGQPRHHVRRDFVQDGGHSQQHARVAADLQGGKGGTCGSSGGGKEQSHAATACRQLATSLPSMVLPPLPPPAPPPPPTHLERGEEELSWRQLQEAHTLWDRGGGPAAASRRPRLLARCCPAGQPLAGMPACLPASAATVQRAL